jgi:precorrin-6B methylase 2
LDVGTGAAWLAIEVARCWPSWRVVGIDRCQPALDLGLQNVAASSLQTASSFGAGMGGDLDDEGAFSLA